MEIILNFEPDYGYVVIVVALSWVFLNWLGMNVVWARHIFNVPYPTMYSSHSDIFNCYQRAHQNTLEYYPLFIVLLLLGGLQFPKVSALSGLIWIAGRVAYAKGYYTGNPDKRMRGVFGYVGLIVLFINTIIFALKLLQWI
ncbi:glutathione S-transferase 3, mitochondrial-like isoform X1 [Liolophura sinensis]|uniref:glutathione S-transferase 3, mitochondrial-like isoform X1 n=1 Tax=Liolophura sinensis TaxID=3198878 RepID=UPI0031580590